MLRRVSCLSRVRVVGCNNFWVALEQIGLQFSSNIPGAVKGIKHGFLVQNRGIAAVHFSFRSFPSCIPVFPKNQTISNKPKNHNNRKQFSLTVFPLAVACPKTKQQTSNKEPTSNNNTRQRAKKTILRHPF